MTGPTAAPVPGDLRCAEWARTEQVDPVATAGSYRGFLVVEWPLPWPRDAGDVTEVARAASAARDAGFRLQLVTRPAGAARRRADGADPAGNGALFVAAYRWDGRRFPGRQLRVAPGDAPAAALALVSDPAAGDPSDATDVLVCGHGRRDRCCGSLGTELAIAFSSAVGSPRAEERGRGDGNVRCWRTSHTGGHRFAPTAILLPAGTVWGYLDGPLLVGIVRREADAGTAARHYRGCAGISSRAGQAVEREALAELGWALFDHERDVDETADGRTRLTVGRSSSRRVFEASVSVRRTLPVPVCGQPAAGSAKHEDELVVSGFAEVG